MKKIYGLMGFSGFAVMLGGAGGADNASFFVSLMIMISGLALILISMFLTQRRIMKMRKKRHLYMKRKSEYCAQVAKSCVNVYHKTPCGIAEIISEKISFPEPTKINSPELC